MDEIIFISVASYRDLDLVNTITNCYNNAQNKGNLFFSIFSQAEDGEHADLSFIPDNQIRYRKSHWSESNGVCWARSITNSDIFGMYFLQIDSHTRFINNWDVEIKTNYRIVKNFWGDRTIITNYPDPFEIVDGKDVIAQYSSLKKISPFWNDSEKMLLGKIPWDDVIDIDKGDEVFYIGAGFIFTTTDVIKDLPYDKDLYFYGEEATLAIRAYTRGIRMVCPNKKYIFSHYNPQGVKRQTHWADHKDWHIINTRSINKALSILSGNKSFGIYGIESTELYNKYQKIIGVDFSEKILQD